MKKKAKRGSATALSTKDARTTKDAWFQIRIQKDLREWLDDFALRHNTNKTIVVTEYLKMLRQIDKGRHDKNERMQTS